MLRCATVIVTTANLQWGVLSRTIRVVSGVDASMLRSEKGIVNIVKCRTMDMALAV
jgi:hypothetical protein